MDKKVKSLDRRPNKVPSDKKKVEQLSSDIDVDTAVIHTDNWRCIVGLLVEKSGSYAKYTKHMNDAIETGLRQVIKSITYADIVKLVKQYRSDTVSSSQAKSVHQKMYDEAYQYATSLYENKIPTHLVARLIKYEIIKIKNEDIKRKETELILAKEIQEESKMMTADSLTARATQEDRRVSGKKRANMKRDIELKKGKEKKGTKLRKRGEEWKDIEFIDDAPEGGADLYIVLSGFYDAALPVELINIGIPLHCVIKTRMGTEDDDFQGERACSGAALSRKLSLDFSARPYAGSTVSIIDEVSIKMQEVSEFWRRFEAHLWSPANMLTFNNVSFMTLLLPTMDAFDSEEDKLSLKQIMYDKIAYIMYDVQDTMRQHQHYLENMKVWRFETEPVISLDHMVIYNSLLNVVPNECTTIPLILHCMLEQVDHMQLSDRESSARNSSVRSPLGASDVVRALESTLAELNQKHDIFDINRDTLELNEPLVVIHGDDILRKTFDCYSPLVDIQKITFTVMNSILPIKLWELYSTATTEAENTFQFHINKLKQCTHNNLTMKTLHNHLYALICHEMKCNKMSASRLPDVNNTHCHNQTSYFSTSRLHRRSSSTNNSKNRLQKHGKFSHNNIYAAKVQCNEFTKLLDNLGISKQDYLDDYRYRYIEEKSPRVLLQSLQVAFSSFVCLDHQYFAPTDTLLLKFHNPVNSEGMYKDCYEANLATPVSLRDFYEYVMDEEWEWISNEEAKYQKKMEAINNAPIPSYHVESSEHVHEQVTTASCLTNYTDLDFLSNVSLKNEMKLTRDNTNARLNDDQKSDLSFLKSIKKNKVGEKREKSKPQLLLKGEPKEIKDNAMKDKSNRDKGSLKELHNISTPQTVLQERLSKTFAEREELYYFEGFDLGPMRLHISGETTRFYSSDGSTVEVCLRHWLYRWTILSIELVICGHTLMFHRYTWLPTIPLQSVLCHVVTDSGMVIVFGKYNLNEPSRENLSEDKSYSGLLESVVSEALPRQQHFTMPGVDLNQNVHNINRENRIPLELQLKLSWPSGLVLETVKEPSIPFYIKQGYINKSPMCTRIRDEKYRCYLQCGIALKFMNNGNAEILHPDSTLIKCSKFRFPVNEIPAKEDTVDTLDERKEDEPRSKGKVKKLDNKAGQVNENKKSSKKKNKPVEKELVIDEYSEDPEHAINVQKLDDCIPNLLDITQYHLITYDGRQFSFKDGITEECFPKYTIRTRSDIELGEIFTRRGEYTSRLLQSDGTHVVSFYDGTRITQSVAEDAQLVFCEWSKEEVDKFYCKEMESAGSRLKLSKNGSTFKHLDEGYVSLKSTYRMEHPNYATVTYHCNDCSAELIMPQENTVVKIFPNGAYCVVLRGSIVVEATSDTINFSHVVPDRGVNLCRSTLNVSESDKSDKDLCCTTDSQGRTFRVAFNGETSFTSEKGKPAQLTLAHGIATERNFAIHRSLKGLELLYETDVYDALETVSHQKYASIVTDTLPDEPQLNFHILMSPLDKSESQNWLIDYKPVRLTDKERRDNNYQKRSTYGDPPSWFHPFPKTDLCAIDAADAIPEVLVLRMIKEIAPPKSNLVRALKECLLRYGEMSDTDEYLFSALRHASLTMAFHPHEPEYPRHKSRQNRITPGASELYRLGRKRKYKHKLTVSEVQAIKLREVAGLVTIAVVESRRECRRRNVSDYKIALRDHVVPPYFSSPRGAAHLLAKECANRAVEPAEATDTLVQTA